MKSIKLGLLFLGSLIVIAAPVVESAQPTPFVCDTSGAADRGDRVFGLDFLDPSADGDFNDNLNRAVEMGVTSLAVHIDWNQIEPTPGQYVDPQQIISTLQNVVPASGMKLNLTIRPIDITGKTVPPDLVDVDFDRVQMAQRFNLMLDYVFTKYDPSSITSIQIGNEIDGYDTSNESPDFWEDYGLFLQRIREHVNSRYFGTKVGFTATLDGLTSGLLAVGGVFQDLAEVVDVIGATYYPVDFEFQVGDPEDVLGDFGTLVSTFPSSQFPTQEIHIQEIGFPSSELNGSDGALQAEFFCNAFKAWDQHDDRIALMNIVRMQDLSEEAAEELGAAYPVNSNEFTEFLRTLGLRTHNGLGQNKPAFQVVSDSAAARGW